MLASLGTDHDVVLKDAVEAAALGERAVAVAIVKVIAPYRAIVQRPPRHHHRPLVIVVVTLAILVEDVVGLGELDLREDDQSWKRQRRIAMW